MTILIIAYLTILLILGVVIVLYDLDVKLRHRDVRNLGFVRIPNIFSVNGTKDYG